MKRTKERMGKDSEKAPRPDVSEVICPLIFKLTGLAVNYDLTWQPETRLTVLDDDGNVISETIGAWKSNPVVRKHARVFQDEIDRMNENGEISWNKSYFFLHEEGIEARQMYEQKVLNGELKAHITSWGPNPKKPKEEDKSRFHKLTGVTYQELVERYPDLYTKTTAKAITADPVVEEKKEEIAPTTEEADATVKVVDEEPSEEELSKIQEEERVAAASATENFAELGDLEDEDISDQDDHEGIVMYIPADVVNERIDVREESVGWTGLDGQTEHQAFLVELPELGREMWLPEGRTTVDGVTYDIRLEKN